MAAASTRQTKALAFNNLVTFSCLLVFLLMGKVKFCLKYQGR